MGTASFAPHLATMEAIPLGAVTLEGKVAVVTGAGHGLGKTIAQLFLSEGARIVPTARVVEQLAEFEGLPEAHPVFGDVTMRDDVDRMIDGAYQHFGQLDILVNNAGLFDAFLSVEEVTEQRWRQELAVNLNGPFFACRRAIPIMLAAGHGTIVNVASISGMVGTRGGAAYVTSKHALLGLTEHISVAYGRKGVRAVAICPGEMKTGIKMGGKPSVHGMAATMRVMTGVRPRRAEPEEVAKIVLFVASDASSYLNGIGILTDCGWVAYQQAAAQLPY